MVVAPPACTIDGNKVIDVYFGSSKPGSRINDACICKRGLQY